MYFLYFNNNPFDNKMKKIYNTKNIKYKIMKLTKICITKLR